MASMLAKRLERYVQLLPRQMAVEFGCYQKLCNNRAKTKWKVERKAINEPYWIVLPHWLHTAYHHKAKHNHNNKALFNDVLWGQYCLFLFVRIQDDVFDGHVRSPSLLYAADQFLFEAERTFANWVPNDSEFWTQYRQRMQETIRAIVLVDHLQRSPVSNLKSLLTAYAQINSVFKIGSIAMCLMHNCKEDIVHIHRFADEIAIGSQILDDLQDLAEDLERKRFNYAASKILQRNEIRRKRHKSLVDEIANALVLTNIGSEIIEEVIAHFQKAYQALEPLDITQAKTFSRAYQRSLAAMKENLLRRRIKLVFKR